MSSAFRRLPVVAVASLSALGGVGLFVGSSRAPTSPWESGAAVATSPDDSTTATGVTSAVTASGATTSIGGASTSTTIAETTTTHPAGFIDPAEARDAAQSLVSAYIESQYDAQVNDPACSLPATGASADEFVCYALRPGDLVIALRATIGDDRLITLTLITDQGAPTTTTSTTTTTVAPAGTTTTAGA